MNQYITYIGCDDTEIDLFEGLFPVPGGMAYNSYLIKDEKIAVMDTIDRHKTDGWTDKLKAALGGRNPDYLIVHHMEPDHSAGIRIFLNEYPAATVVGNAKTFAMMTQFFGEVENKLVVSDGDELSLGDCTLKFVFAPMVHWPEVMVSYEKNTKSLFSADAFGKFGALKADQPWDDESRRYYYNIVGKFGSFVQKLLTAAGTLDIETIYPLHGPVLSGDLSHYFGLYQKWSRWEAEEKGIVIAVGSAHGNTLSAATKLADLLKAKGQTVRLYDVSRTDPSFIIAEAFKYDRLVLAATTYYSELYPAMETFLSRLLSKGYNGRNVGIIENGTWLAQSAKKMTAMLDGAKNIRILQPVVSIKSALSGESEKQMEALVDALCTE